jgi:hypothetical protein
MVPRRPPPSLLHRGCLSAPSGSGTGDGEMLSFGLGARAAPGVAASGAFAPFRRSSVVERAAVNRLVGGSNPPAGATSLRRHPARACGPARARRGLRPRPGVRFQPGWRYRPTRPVPGDRLESGWRKARVAAVEARRRVAGSALSEPAERASGRHGVATAPLGRGDAPRRGDKRALRHGGWSMSTTGGSTTGGSTTGGTRGAAPGRSAVWRRWAAVTWASRSWTTVTSEWGAPDSSTLRCVKRQGALSSAARATSRRRCR